MARRSRQTDLHLLDALKEAYTARARLFHSRIAASRLDLLLAEIDAIEGDKLHWGNQRLAVSAAAARRVRETGGHLHQVFAHPDVITRRPYLLTYYRNIVTLSKKGIGQLGFPTERYEERRTTIMSIDDAAFVCRALNQILSGVIETLPRYDVDLSRKAILAELGTEIQGTWANTVGKKAPKAVEDVLAEHIRERNLGDHTEPGRFALTNGWTIRFASEPDVTFRDQQNTTQIVIEIKGSLDVAGAQTRYGEAKKSFAKELARNPRCHTIYLASCYTDSVISQIEQDGHVRDWYNLTSILYDPREKSRFLKRLFHRVLAP